jgi:hypothetical protein
MFNKSTPHDSVPLQDNQFTIDNSIEEFTALVLSRPGAKPVKLQAPDHTEIGQEQRPENVRWVHEAGYDLVTLTRPSPGAWKLIADVDPDNQVLVVTHLKMNGATLPNYLKHGEALPELAASFTESDQPITREDFLQLVTVEATLSEGEGHQTISMPLDKTRPAQFVGKHEGSLENGEYTLTIKADGKTFQRSVSQTFKVVDDAPPAHEESHAAEHEPEAEQKPVEEHAQAEGVDWVKTLSIAAGVNVLIGAGGYGAIRFLRKRRDAVVNALLDKLS